MVGAAARTGRTGLLAGTAALALLLGPIAASPDHASSQTLGPLSGEVQLDRDAQMLLEADELIYDFDRRTVVALGSVRVLYSGHQVEAVRITYHQDSGRLLASGGVRIVDPRGNVTTAQEIDITDDFRDGFVRSINMRTAERTSFAAESAERRDGEITIFHRGVYTACEPCKDDPLRPPLWQVKASRIVHDQEEKTVSYRHARLEFFGVPVAYFPYFQHPDPTVKRKTGFLAPIIGNDTILGYSVATPFFWALAPNYDITFTPTYYTRQGLLAQAEWRHQLVHGAYSIRVAGILQRDPEAFTFRGVPTSGSRERRGSIASRGVFEVHPDWWLGWDVYAASDRSFGRNYKTEWRHVVPSHVRLTNLGERDHFDLRGYHFWIQRGDETEQDFRSVEALLANQKVGLRALWEEAGFRSFSHANREATAEHHPLLRELLDLETVHHDVQRQQAIVHPVLDHNYIYDRPVLGGELRVDSNLTALSRDLTDLRVRAPLDSFNGVAGSFARTSTDVSWQRSFHNFVGQEFTPFAYLKSDLYYIDPDDPRPGLANETVWRAMPAMGLEFRWPFQAVSSWGTQTFGPVAQIITRPNEQHVGGLPNEDAHSLVFDDTTLFARDKFSGFDRQEGGTRANIGFHYQGRLHNGMSVDAIVGQSYHLAGTNSFADRGLTLTGVGSGLETSRSDYVARATLNTGRTLSVTARGRFDEDDLQLNRGELSATASYGRLGATAEYVFMRENPLIGVLDDRQQVKGAVRLPILDNLSMAAAITYDLEHQSTVGQGIEITYRDECVTITASYSEANDRFTDEISGRWVGLRIELRTLGGTGYSERLYP